MRVLAGLPPSTAMSAKEVRAAMASLEDADDVEAGRALEREAADEQMEFDDNAASSKVLPRCPVESRPGVVAGVTSASGCM